MRHSVAAKIRSHIIADKNVPAKFCLAHFIFVNLVNNAPVAQLDRAFGFGPKGWGFKSVIGR
jgi:hypothetical protein